MCFCEAALQYLTPQPLFTQSLESFGEEPPFSVPCFNAGTLVPELFERHIYLFSASQGTKVLSTGPLGNRAYENGDDVPVLPTAEPSLCMNWSALLFWSTPVSTAHVLEDCRRWGLESQAERESASTVTTFLKCKVLSVECAVFTGFPNPRSPHFLCWWWAPGLWRKLHGDCHFHRGNITGTLGRGEGLLWRECVIVVGSVGRMPVLHFNWCWKTSVDILICSKVECIIFSCANTGTWRCSRSLYFYLVVMLEGRAEGIAEKDGWCGCNLGSSTILTYYGSCWCE